MFIIKHNYFLYIENINDLDVDSLKENKKINIILRNAKNNKISEIKKYQRKCKIKKFKLYIANNIKVAKACNADGLYISAFNKKIYHNSIYKIGSAHNFKEINEKTTQQCKIIIISPLFKTNYPNKKSFLGITKFNLLKKNINLNFCPLGGIRYSNLIKLKLVNCKSIALLSEIKKKPTIASRLF